MSGPEKKSTKSRKTTKDGCSEDGPVYSTDDGIIFCWMGPRQSDQFFTGLFDYSITLFGDGEECSRKLLEEMRGTNDSQVDNSQLVKRMRERSYNRSFCHDSPLRFYRNGEPVCIRPEPRVDGRLSGRDLYDRISDIGNSEYRELFEKKVGADLDGYLCKMIPSLMEEDRESWNKLIICANVRREIIESIGKAPASPDDVRFRNLLMPTVIGSVTKIADDPDIKGEILFTLIERLFKPKDTGSAAVKKKGRPNDPEKARIWKYRADQKNKRKQERKKLDASVKKLLKKEITPEMRKCAIRAMIRRSGLDSTNFSETELVMEILDEMSHDNTLSKVMTEAVLNDPEFQGHLNELSIVSLGNEYADFTRDTLHDWIKKNGLWDVMGRNKKETSLGSGLRKTYVENIANAIPGDARDDELAAIIRAEMRNSQLSEDGTTALIKWFIAEDIMRARIREILGNPEDIKALVTIRNMGCLPTEYKANMDVASNSLDRAIRIIAQTPMVLSILRNSVLGDDPRNDRLKKLVDLKSDDISITEMRSKRIENAFKFAISEFKLGEDAVNKILAEYIEGKEKMLEAMDQDQRKEEVPPWFEITKAILAIIGTDRPTTEALADEIVSRIEDVIEAPGGQLAPWTELYGNKPDDTALLMREALRHDVLDDTLREIAKLGNETVSPGTIELAPPKNPESMEFAPPKNPESMELAPAPEYVERVQVPPFIVLDLPLAGEDAPPVAAADGNAGRLIVCDGMGGGGGQHVFLDGEVRTMAFAASRCVMAAADAFIKENHGRFMSDGIGDACRELGELMASSLTDCANKNGMAFRRMGTLARFLPTTFASAVYLDEGDAVSVSVIWAGDSRVYCVLPDSGLHPLTKDDSKSEADDQATILQDAPMSNVVSIESPFHLNYRRFTIPKPCMLFASSDGVSQYAGTPMHLEKVLITKGERTIADSMLDFLKSHGFDDRTFAAAFIGCGEEEFTESISSRAGLIDDLVAKAEALEAPFKAKQAEYKAACRAYEAEPSEEAKALKDELQAASAELQAESQMAITELWNSSYKECYYSISPDSEGSTEDIVSEYVKLHRPCRIEHNETSIEQGMFLALEQLKLMEQHRGAQVCFMNYNPNYVPRSLFKNPEFAILSGITKLDGNGAESPDDDKIKALNSIIGIYNQYSSEDNKNPFNRVLGKMRGEFKNVMKKLGYPDEGREAAEKAIEVIQQSTLCFNKDAIRWNDAPLMDMLDNKQKFRIFCKKYEIPTLESRKFSDTQIEALEEAGSGKKDKDSKPKLSNPKAFMDTLRSECRTLVGGDCYVVQLEESSGGAGTFILGKPDGNHDIDPLSTKKLFENLKDVVVSRYLYPNIPVNVHAIIGKREILLTRPSIQIILERNGHLTYCGGDYIAYTKYVDEGGDHLARHKELMRDVMTVCTHLQTLGYRGIIGFDAIISDNEVRLVESNNRFQASTYLLNRAYYEASYNPDGSRKRSEHLVPSMQALNLMAFLENGYQKKAGKQIRKMSQGNDDYLISRILDRISSRARVDKKSPDDEKFNDITPDSFGDGGFSVQCIEIQDFPVDYSTFIYYNNTHTVIGNKHAKMVYQKVKLQSDELSLPPLRYSFELDGLDEKFLVDWTEKTNSATGDKSQLVLENDAFLFKLIEHDNNIVSAFEDSICINPNLPEPDRDLRYIHRRTKGLREPDELIDTRRLDMLDLKIQLVNRGIVKAKSENSEKEREGVNHSLDLDLFPFRCEGKEFRFLYHGAWYEYLPINCPKDTDISKFSPFRIKLMEDKKDLDNTKPNQSVYKLLYYGEELPFYLGSDTKIQVQGTMNDMDIDPVDNVPFDKICIFSTDRLRVQHSNICKYVQYGRGCKFCELSAGSKTLQLDTSQVKKYRFDEDTIKKAVERAFDSIFAISCSDDEAAEKLKESRLFTHVLVGGATLPSGESKMIDRITEICDCIEAQKAKLRERLKSERYAECFSNNPFYKEIEDSRSRDWRGQPEKGRFFSPQRFVDEMSIYLMSVPPSSKYYLDRLFEHGVSQVGFNIEIFTHNIAHRAMPGKSEIPLAQYITSLDLFANDYSPKSVASKYERIRKTLENEVNRAKEESASYSTEDRIRKITDERKSLKDREIVAKMQRFNTRTAFIIGLDTDEGLIRGVDVAISMRVAPILSIFRPVKGTDYGNLMPPSCNDLYRLYREISARCKAQKVELGPECLFCQNNVLALPESLEPSDLNPEEGSL